MARALPFHVLGALAILRRFHTEQPHDLRARVEPWIDHLETMYRETAAQRRAGDERAFKRKRRR